MDIDLPELTQLFQTVRLTDLDQPAVEHGVSEQFSGLMEADICRRRIRIQAPIDLAHPITKLTPQDFLPSCDMGEICRALLEPLELSIDASADVVVSTCVLSQMINSLTALHADQHPQFARLLRALRQSHFLRMVQLLKPGGTGIFITDLVSSETVPELPSTENTDLPKLLTRCLQAGNFFSGLHPGVALQDLRRSPSLAPHACKVEMQPPWRWQMGPRTYAVYALVFQRTIE